MEVLRVLQIHEADGDFVRFLCKPESGIVNANKETVHPLYTMKKPFVPQPLPHDDVKWEPLIPLIGQANRALAQYDGILYGVPNPAVLLSPLTTQEAVLSSRIVSSLVPRRYRSCFRVPESLVEFAVKQTAAAVAEHERLHPFSIPRVVLRLYVARHKRRGSAAERAES